MRNGVVSVGAEFAVAVPTMGRPLRYIRPGEVVEVTMWTIQSRLLLRPSEELNRLMLGVLGRALARFEVELHAFVFVSNHVHLLLTPANGKALADFMAYVNRRISLEAGKLHDWEGPLWSRRYRAIAVVDEESQVARLRYLFEHGAKEGFVSGPGEWPGANCVSALVDGRTMTGVWVERSAMYEAWRAGKSVDQREFEVEYEVALTPLPCWRHLPPEEYRQRCGEMVADIERETAARNAELGRKPLGVAWVLAQEPHDKPRDTHKSPAPLVHAATRKARRAFKEAYRAFVEAYRHAADRLRWGERDVEFPVGAFPPPGPFVIGST